MTDIYISLMTLADVEAMCTMADCPDIKRLSIFTAASDRGEGVKEVFRRLVQANSTDRYRSYSVFKQGRVVGYVCAVRDAQAPDEFWIGCWTEASMRGKGISRLAIQLLVDMLRASEPKAVFRASVRNDNTSSLKLMASIGFQETAHDKTSQMKAFVLK